MIKIGSIYNTNNYGSVVVLSNGSKYDYFKVRFLDTGTEKEFRSSQIKDGCIRDPYAISVCGVGCTGDIKTKGKYKTLYGVWHDMINRCYNEKCKHHEAYKNVKVANRWLVFKNFYEDAPKICGFDEERIKSGEVVLDKDIKQRFSLNKIYSYNTCTWVDKSLNNKIQDSQQKPFEAISPNGDVYKDTNITDFARKHNLSRRHISGVLHGRAKSTQGWKFKYIYSEDII